MKKCVAILFGGPSTEHEISVITAMEAINSFPSEDYDFFPIYVSKNLEFLYSNKFTSTKNMNKENIKNAKKVDFLKTENGVFLTTKTFFGIKKITPIDILFPIFHGSFGEDGSIQGFFDVLDIPYVGPSVQASVIGQDKHFQHEVLKNAGFSIPNFEVVFSFKFFEDPNSVLNRIEKNVKFPCIAKPANLGSSIGISVVESKEKLSEALELIFELDQKCVVEEFITDFKEINCSVLGFENDVEASVVEELKKEKDFLDFADKYVGDGAKKGGKKVNNLSMLSATRNIPAKISDEKTKEIQTLAKKVFTLLGMSGVSRIDFMLKDEKLYITELNSQPGSLSFYLWEAKGLSYKNLIKKLLQIAEKVYAKKKSLIRTFDDIKILDL